MFQNSHKVIKILGNLFLCEGKTNWKRKLQLTPSECQHKYLLSKSQFSHFPIAKIISSIHSTWIFHIQTVVISSRSGRKSFGKLFISSRAVYVRRINNQNVVDDIFLVHPFFPPKWKSFLKWIYLVKYDHTFDDLFVNVNFN